MLKTIQRTNHTATQISTRNLNQIANDGSRQSPKNDSKTQL